MKIIIIIFSLCASLLCCILLIGLMGEENIVALLCHTDTVYAPKYKESAFRSIEVGFSQEQVRELMGDPLRSVHLTSSSRTGWIYATENTNSRIHNFRIRNIQFDENGKVIKKETGVYGD